MLEDAISETVRARYGASQPSMGGLDLLEVGDLKQATAIGDYGIYVTGKYTGTGKNLPPGGGERPDDDLDVAQLTMSGR